MRSRLHVFYRVGLGIDLVVGRAGKVIGKQPPDYIGVLVHDRCHPLVLQSSDDLLGFFKENILFPILRKSEKSIRVEGVVQEQIEDLLKEHSEERSLVAETQLALFSERPSEFAESARKLVKVLSEHALK